MTSKTVIVLGGGVGGLSVANDLRRRLNRQHKVVLVDKTGDHVFWPSLLWLQVGLRKPDKITKGLEKLLKKGVELVRGEVDSIDPVAKRVGVGGKTYDADYLVVSLGAQLAPDRIPGLSDAGHNLYSLEGSVAVRNFCLGLDGEAKGTKLVVLVSGMPFKCPAAPYEAAMLMAHYAQNNHPGTGTSVSLYSPEGGPMGVAGPVVSAGVKGMLAQRGVDYYPTHQVEKVDPGTRTLIFEDGSEATYDFLAYVPPHVVPEVVCEAGLAEVGGWIMVDRESMETRYPGVFAIGDNTSIPLEMGLPLPKAGVFAHGQAQAVAKTIAARINGKGEDGVFDGHGQCFVEVGGGRAGFGRGNFYASPVAQVKLHEPSRRWHIAKVLFEKKWMKQWF
ncbi:MAG: NAD(P)/FAD-dependent oxidoreductase [SAR202 cluster bacterium]|nr:NAD(P)/FAD-dependent oxidoreductase [SAR202 cluster bacterium]